MTKIWKKHGPRGDRTWYLCVTGLKIIVLRHQITGPQLPVVIYKLADMFVNYQVNKQTITSIIIKSALAYAAHSFWCWENSYYIFLVSKMTEIAIFHFGHLVAPNSKNIFSRFLKIVFFVHIRIFKKIHQLHKKIFFPEERL